MLLCGSTRRASGTAVKPAQEKTLLGKVGKRIFNVTVLRILLFVLLLTVHTYTYHEFDHNGTLTELTGKLFRDKIMIGR